MVRLSAMLVCYGMTQVSSIFSGKHWELTSLMIWLDLSRSKWHNSTVYCLTKLRDKLECLFQSIHKIKSLHEGTHQSCTRRFRTGKSTEPCSCSCESCRRRWSRLGLRLSSYVPLSGWLLCLAVESWGQPGKCCPENYVPTLINPSGVMVRWYRLTTLDHSMYLHGLD